MGLLALALLVNAMIVFPVASGMVSGQPGMDAAFGPPSDARAILASVYLAIGLVSVAGLIGLALGFGQTIVPMAMGLLVVQITYKAITIATVGPASPVVMTNIAVIVLHSATVLWLLRAPAYP